MINMILVNNLTNSLRKDIVVACVENLVCTLLPVPPSKLVVRYLYVLKKEISTYSIVTVSNVKAGDGTPKPFD